VTTDGHPGIEFDEYWKETAGLAVAKIYSTLGPGGWALFEMIGPFPRREVARLWTLLRISVKMAAQSLGSSKTHSSDSRYNSPAPEGGIENETVLEGAGTFRASACLIFRSVMLVAFKALMRSLIVLGAGEPVRLAGCTDELLGPAGLEVWSRSFS
jgi:hypothetical protein